ncbi:MAG: hypothetical protein F6K55_44405 [Moorea sp. SIO4A3]|nr:hypothetical protein [Moorena sp. SIO4A3]
MTYGQSRLAVPSQYRNGRSRFQLRQPIPGYLSGTVCKLINTINWGLLRNITTVLTITSSSNLELPLNFPSIRAIA